MFASKILTFNKKNFLSKLAGDIVSSQCSQKEFFNIGHPIDSPPTLRGSIVVEFGMNFISDNKDFFEYGSPIDIGSLLAGYISFYHSDSCDDIKMNFLEFIKILDEISSIESFDKQSFLRHEITDSVQDILRRTIRSDIVDFIRLDKNPHSRLFEFCLSSGYKIDDTHIKKIHIPNTYKDSSIMREISNRFKNKVKTFNPKYGFENRNVA